ncbi:hypothetical protein GA0115259_1082110 [Streptomyces sp. MnatMP-M17]|nr:hypothetical protein GA0115259_1082110 [Streptomyces sp. MnatMP-M17]
MLLGGRHEAGVRQGGCGGFAELVCADDAEPTRALGPVASSGAESRL